jgi:hypothetical protein
MATMSDEQNPISAADVMSAAIDFNIKTGRMLYPNGSRFVDADGPHIGRLIAEAADEGRPLVLCYADGTRRIVEARSAPSAA